MLSSKPSPECRYPSQSQLASDIYALPDRSPTDDILSRMYPKLAVEVNKSSSSTQQTRFSKPKMSEKTDLTRSYAPNYTVPLLRHESAMAKSETALIEFVTEQQKSRDTSTPSQGEHSPGMSQVAALFPKPLKDSTSKAESKQPYELFEAPVGIPLLNVYAHLSSSERRAVDKGVGLLARALANITSPTATFGPINRVLSHPSASNSIVPPAQKGLKTWSQGFNPLLESVLRDGEDMSVLIPYETIREHFRRVSWRLDDVLVPRLLILDIACLPNVMVERRNNDSSADAEEPLEEASLSGLRSWRLGVFGDPLLSSCFEEPSEGFLEGWEGGGEDIIEDPENVEVRKLLYSCYRAVVGIVTEYYRPQPDSSKREMDRRRRLTKALAALEKVDNPPSEIAIKRARSMSRGGSVSKRQKLEKDEEDDNA